MATRRGGSTVSSENDDQQDRAQAIQRAIEEFIRETRGGHKGAQKMVRVHVMERGGIGLQVGELDSEDKGKRITGPQGNPNKIGYGMEDIRTGKDEKGPVTREEIGLTRTVQRCTGPEISKRPGEGSREDDLRQQEWSTAKDNWKKSEAHTITRQQFKVSEHTANNRDKEKVMHPRIKKYEWELEGWEIGVHRF